MTDSSFCLPHWPNAYPDTQASGLLKSQNSDFRVVEIPSMNALGEGEHLWLWVEKQGANSAWVAQQLADFAGVSVKDVGMAGLKDRHSISQQWFSVYLPKGGTPNFLAIEHPEFKVLQQTRHSKKLRRGDLLGNQFMIVLREIKGDPKAIEANLQQLQEHGFPNYFGEQRFGHDGNNVVQGQAMLNRTLRVRSATQKGLYLSAVRSFLFNEVLAARIQQNTWMCLQAGDVEDSHQRPTGPMWGRGRLVSSEATGALETTIGQQHAELCLGLEHAGLSQERRSLVGLAQNLTWDLLADDVLQLQFSLASGYYATSLIKEIMRIQEPERS